MADYRVSIGSSFDRLAGADFVVDIALLGAELKSLVHRGRALLWNDRSLGDLDHAWWKLSAPILFPIVGGLNGNRGYSSTGAPIQLPYHGFASCSRFRRVGASEGRHGATLAYELDTAMVREQHRSTMEWPWDCTLTIRYVLDVEGLRVEFSVRNDDARVLPFQIGWHPGFRTPALMESRIASVEEKHQVSIRVPPGRHTRWKTNRASQLTGEHEHLDCDGSFSYTEEGLDFTYVLDLSRETQTWVRLSDPVAGLTQTLVMEHFPHLGIWSDPGAPFICLEPWQGSDDFAIQTPFEDRFGIKNLAPGQTWRGSVRHTCRYGLDTVL